MYMYQMLYKFQRPASDRQPTFLVDRYRVGFTLYFLKKYVEIYYMHREESKRRKTLK